MSAAQSVEAATAGKRRSCVRRRLQSVEVVLAETPVEAEECERTAAEAGRFFRALARGEVLP